MAGSLTAAIFMIIFIVAGLWYGERRGRQKKLLPVQDRIYELECANGMCDFAGHDHSKPIKPPVGGMRPPPKSVTVSAADAYIKTKRELEKTQLELAAIREELDGFKRRFNYRHYESGSDYEERYTVHEISTLEGHKMIYTEPVYRTEWRKEMKPIPTKRMRI
jgi:hypothetical protein